MFGNAYDKIVLLIRSNNNSLLRTNCNIVEIKFHYCQDQIALLLRSNYLIAEIKIAFLLRPDNIITEIKLQYR